MGTQPLTQVHVLFFAMWMLWLTAPLPAAAQVPRHQVSLQAAESRDLRDGGNADPHSTGRGRNSSVDGRPAADTPKGTGRGSEILSVV